MLSRKRVSWQTFLIKQVPRQLEANGARISIPGDRNFESEGEAIESGLRRLSTILTRLVANRKAGRGPLEAMHSSPLRYAIF
jgi:hypothetical protein